MKASDLPAYAVLDTLIPLLCDFEISRHEATRIPGKSDSVARWPGRDPAAVRARLGSPAETDPTRRRGSDPRPSAPGRRIPSRAPRVGPRTTPTSPISMRHPRKSRVRPHGVSDRSGFIDDAPSPSKRSPIMTRWRLGRRARDDDDRSHDSRSDSRDGSSSLRSGAVDRLPRSPRGTSGFLGIG